MARRIFYISDGTGITAETIGHSVLTQFESVEFETMRIPFVDSVDKALEAAERVRLAGLESGLRPVVVNTVVDPDLTRILSDSGALMMDVFAPFIAPLEQELGTKRQPRVGKAHGLVDFAQYEARINATNYALTHDDGIDFNYNDADVILVGVSRSGKTPTCVYLALQYGVYAANYPLTEDDLESVKLPALVAQYRSKLYGLTIGPDRLQQIRQERRPDSRYSSAQQCAFEVRSAERMFDRFGIPYMDTTDTSIEEIASRVLERMNIARRVRP